MRATLKPVSTEDPKGFAIAEADVLYRPLHVLFGFKDGVAKWTEEYVNRIHKPTVIDLNMVQAADTPWEELGFPGFDNSAEKAIVAQVQDLVQKGLRVTLTYTHMASFRVVRGLW